MSEDFTKEDIDAEFKELSREPDFQWLPVGDLVPADYNPRAIEDDNFEGLRESIKKWGIADALVVNRRNRVIVGGHRRLDAAMLEGMKVVPVRWVDLDETEEAALNLALNNQNIQGHFTPEVFKIIERIKEHGIGIDLTKLRMTTAHLAKIVPNFSFNNWQSDLGKVTNVDEHERGMYDTVTIAVLKGVDVDDLKTRVKEALSGIDFEFR
jgi:hypothetical protein